MSRSFSVPIILSAKKCCLKSVLNRLLFQFRTAKKDLAVNVMKMLLLLLMMMMLTQVRSC